MYTNKCIKCGCEFETKNPKRVICPNCLYPERKAPGESSGDGNESSSTYKTSYNSYSAGSERQDLNYSSQRAGGNYNRAGNNPNQRYHNKSYSSSYRKDGNTYRNTSYGVSSSGQKYGNNQNSRRPQQKNARGGFKSRYSQGGQAQKRDASKRLLVTKEQMQEIETLYKAMLPLPNHDAYEVIAEKLGIEPRKVFFGINLVRQKLMLPKLNFPKRKLAVTEDQVFAIKNLYEPLLPLPPIGCHKIIAAQLKMDEWRVHVGIGVVRRQMGLERWNLERTDIPESLREKEVQSKIRKAEKKALEKAKKAELKKQRELEKTLKENKQKQNEQSESNSLEPESQEVKDVKNVEVAANIDNNEAEKIKVTEKKCIVKKTTETLEE